MGGFVTWERELFPNPTTMWVKVKNGVRTTGDSRVLGSPAFKKSSQSTTSFRTGHEGTGENDEVIPTSRSQAFRTWFLENRELSNPSDSGHTFSSLKHEVICEFFNYEIANPSGTIRYLFPLYEDYRQNTGSVSFFPTPAIPDLNWYGSQAIAKTLPTNPVSDMSTAFGEFAREGFPHLIQVPLAKAKTFLLRDTGSEYLNIEFGWKPFINDFTDLLKAVVKSGDLVKQYARDSGRVIRRGYDFPTIRTTLRDSSGFTGKLASPDNSSDFLALHPSGGMSGQLRDVITLEQKLWYKGAYSYLLLDGDNLLEKAERYSQLAKYLLGIRLTPEVLWNLAPWSWLSDWILNVGNVLHNIEALSSDGLVIRYGYLMCTSTYTRTRTVTGVKHSTGTYPPITTIYRSTRKERVKATAYGFGLNPSSFTARQKAILSAIAVSRRR